MRRAAEIAAIAIIVLMVAAIGIGAGVDTNRKRAEWFKECEQYRPHYECVVLWDN